MPLGVKCDKFKLRGPLVIKMVSFRCKICNMNYKIEDIVLSFNKKKCTYYVQKTCKKCSKQKSKEYKLNHKEEIIKQRAEYYKTVKDDIKTYKKENPDIVKKARINFYNKNKKYIIKKCKV